LSPLLCLAPPRDAFWVPVLPRGSKWNFLGPFEPWNAGQTQPPERTAPIATGQPPPPATPPPAPSNWAPDYRQVGIGFVAGLLVAVFVGMQLRESRRRRQRYANSGPPPLPESTTRLQPPHGHERN